MRNTSEEFDKLMKPFHNSKGLTFPERERMVTHNSIQFEDKGHQQRVENINL